MRVCSLKLSKSVSVSSIYMSLDLPRYTIFLNERDIRGNTCQKMEQTCGDRRSLVSKDHKQTICNCVENNFLLNLKQLKGMVSENLNIQCSMATIDHVLKELYFAVKNAYPTSTSKFADFYWKSYENAIKYNQFEETVDI